MSTEVAENDAPAQPSLGQKTTRGAVWLVGQSVVTRGQITLGQQLVLAWLLTKADFGLMGLVVTVTALVTTMANPGIDTVLVHRLRHFRHWATPAFWLGMTMAFAGMGLMFLLAPVAAWAYQDPSLIGLIVVSALALPFQALQIVAKAKLQIELRFRVPLVLLTGLGTVLTAVLTIVAAWLGAGAYSFVLPLPITACVVSAATWQIARPPIRRQLAFPRWKFLFGNSMAVGVTNLISAFINQADFMTLGLAGLPNAMIGAYVFAYNVAIQPLRVISANVPVVLFPGLSHLSTEPARQISATLRAMRLLALVTVPVGLLQIVMTEPVFRLLFPPIWLDAILPCQILTLGLMVNALCWPSVSLLFAQGRFRDQMWLTAGAAVVFVAIMVTMVLIQPSIVSVAIGVTVFHCLYSPALQFFAMRGHAPFSAYLSAIAGPLVAAFAAALPCVLLQMTLPTNIVGHVVAISVGSLIFCAVYLLAAQLFLRATLHDLVRQLAPYWNRLRGGDRIRTVGSQS